MVVLIIMVILVVVVILIVMILILMAWRFVVIVVSPDEASRKQHGDCAQQDRQFQSRPFGSMHRVSSGNDETAWSSKGNDACIDGELHQGFCPGLGASAVNTLDQAAKRQRFLLEIVFHGRTLGRNVAQ